MLTLRLRGQRKLINAISGSRNRLFCTKTKFNEKEHILLPNIDIFFPKVITQDLQFRKWMDFAKESEGSCCLYQSDHSTMHVYVYHGNKQEQLKHAMDGIEASILSEQMEYNTYSINEHVNKGTYKSWQYIDLNKIIELHTKWMRDHVQDKEKQDAFKNWLATTCSNFLMTPYWIETEDTIGRSWTFMRIINHHFVKIRCTQTPYKNMGRNMEEFMNMGEYERFYCYDDDEFILFMSHFQVAQTNCDKSEIYRVCVY